MTLSGAPGPQHGRAKGRIDAAEGAGEGTAQAGLQRGVGRSRLQVAETMPVVGAIPGHIEKIPGLACHITIQIRHQRRGRIPDADCPPPYATVPELQRRECCGARKAIEQAKNGCRSFTLADIGIGLFQQRTFRQRGGMGAHDQRGNVGERIQISQTVPAGRHALRGGGGLLSIDHKHRQTWRDLAAICFRGLLGG